MCETTTKQTPTVSTDIAWDVILDAIRDGKAILIIGGELFNQNGKSLDVQLQEAVGAHAKTYNDGLFHFKGSGLILSYAAIRRFYEQSFGSVAAVLDKIAQIPFPIMLSTTPDKHLRLAFDRQKLGYDYDFYFKRQPAKPLAQPTASKPLVYNLFGDLSERNSLVLTYDDLFDYLSSTSEGKSMSAMLKAEIQRANNFIFLGLPFEKWYVRLLLRVLEQHTQESKHLLKYAANQTDSGDDIRTFCQDDFNITTVSHNIEAFVNELYKRCMEAGLLREPIVLPSLYQKVRNMLMEGRVRSALDELIIFFNTHYPQMTTEINYLILLKSQLNDNEHNLALKRKTREEYDIDNERIKSAVLSFIDEHKSLLK